MPIDYSQTIRVRANASNSFTAITETIGDWWGVVDGKILKDSDEFTVKFGETFWKFRTVEFTPNTKLVWECVDAHHVHAGLSDIEKEWVGTRVEWRLTERDNGTEIEMTHKGLNPSLNCYGVCKEGWDYFFLKSLRTYLNRK